MNREEDKILFNFHDSNNDFSMGATKVPPYTDLFWTMFFKIAPFLGDMNKQLLQASDEIAIDAIRDMIVKVPLLDDNNDFETKEIPQISADLQAMIDYMLYVLCYGHKAMFEDRVPAASLPEPCPENCS